MLHIEEGGRAMTTFAQAYEIAKALIGDNMEIYSASESTARWFFFFGARVKLANGDETGPLPLPGGDSVIAISKASGEREGLDLPGIPSFVTGDEPTEDEKEIDESTSIPLPEQPSINER